jgi:hypothetical protein
VRGWILKVLYYTRWGLCKQRQGELQSSAQESARVTSPLSGLPWELLASLEGGPFRSLLASGQVSLSSSSCERQSWGRGTESGRGKGWRVQEQKGYFRDKGRPHW